MPGFGGRWQFDFPNCKSWTLKVRLRLPVPLSRAMLVALILSGSTLSSKEVTSRFNMQTETACEAQMLDRVGAREVFSGKVYKVLSQSARAYGRAIPHLYVFPGSWNMAYIAASAAVDGRGKILVGEQATEQFNTI